MSSGFNSRHFFLPYVEIIEPNVFRPSSHLANCGMRKVGLARSQASSSNLEETQTNSTAVPKYQKQANYNREQRHDPIGQLQTVSIH